MPNFRLGMRGKLYVSATPFAGSDPSDVTITDTDVMGNVRNVTINLETGEADITTRDNDGWRAFAATLKEGTIEFESIWKPGDTKFEIIKDAWLDGAEIGAAALDTDYDAGGEGVAGNFVVTNFTRNEDLEEAMTVSVTLRPSTYSQWYEGSGSGS